MQKKDFEPKNAKTASLGLHHLYNTEEIPSAINEGLKGKVVSVQKNISGFVQIGPCSIHPKALRFKKKIK